MWWLRRNCAAMPASAGASSTVYNFADNSSLTASRAGRYADAVGGRAISAVRSDLAPPGVAKVAVRHRRARGHAETVPVKVVGIPSWVGQDLAVEP